ncbi:MAG: hypothetical protein E5V59_01610 [Mesorhizobium sp.]|nr:MAG: hypothetical protein E5V59_01610 [Mesorhizobium sp.]
MSRRGVGKIAPISATSPSAPVDIGQTNSILTDPDGRWLAKRQSDINAALGKRCTHASSFGDASVGEHEEHSSTQKPPGRFSGESKRIGQGNWGDKAHFGKHVGYV